MKPINWDAKPLIDEYTPEVEKPFMPELLSNELDDKSSLPTKSSTRIPFDCIVLALAYGEWISTT